MSGVVLAWYSIWSRCISSRGINVWYFVGQFVYSTLNRALIPCRSTPRIELILLVRYGYMSRKSLLLVKAHSLTSLNFVLGLRTKTLVVGQEHTFTFANSVTPRNPATVVKVTDTVKSATYTVSSVVIKRWCIHERFLPCNDVRSPLELLALAMYLAAPAEKRSQVGGALFSVAFCSFLTGITEPLGFHVRDSEICSIRNASVFTGLSLVVNMFGTLHGFSFSAILIDFVLWTGV